MPLIKKICENFISKIKKYNEYNFNACILICLSLKESKIYKDSDNDAMFKFWFRDHFDFVKKIITNEKNMDFIIKFLRKELLKTSSYTSVKAEI